MTVVASALNIRGVTRIALLVRRESQTIAQLSQVVGLVELRETTFVTCPVACFGVEEPLERFANEDRIGSCVNRGSKEHHGHQAMVIVMPLQKLGQLI